MSLLLMICMLGGAGVFGKSISNEDPPVSRVENVDDILEINRGLIPEHDPDSSFLMEGDIMKTKSFSMFSPRTSQWPKLNDVVTIPYVLSDSYEPDHMKIIKDAFNDLESETCLRFVPRTDQRDYISIEPDLGCFSAVGRTGKKQLVSLSFACLEKGKGVVLHELMHVAGFWHEHSRADRDLYVYINWKAIMSGYERNFCRFETTNMLVDYAYNSILHYSSKAFSSNGSATILPLSGHTATEIGQRVKLSISDTLRVNKYYYCPQYTPSPGDHEILTRDSPVAYDCPETSFNEDVNLTEVVFSKTTPATIQPFTNKSEPSPTSQQSMISQAATFSYTELSKPQTTLNEVSEKETMFHAVSAPALNSNSTPSISETSSPNLSSGKPTPWSATSMAMSVESELQSRVGDVWNASLEVVTGLAIPGDLEESAQFSRTAKFVIGCSNEHRKKHSTTASTGLQGGIPVTEATLGLVQGTPMPESKKLEETFTSANSTEEIKESNENAIVQGTLSAMKTSVIATVVPTILAHSLTDLLQTSVRIGTMQNLEIKDTSTQTPASSQSTLTPEQTTSEDLWNGSAHIQVFTYPEDPAYTNLNKKLLETVGKRSLSESLLASKSGKSYGSRTERSQRWKNANQQTHSHSNTRKDVVLTLGNKIKQSRSALHNLFFKITASESLPALREINWQIPYMGRSSKVKTNPELVCGFEHGLCGWKSMNDDFDWNLSWGSLNPHTGYFRPGGFHLSLKSSSKGVSTEQKALLLSSIIQPFSCMSFWYGSGHSIMGRLNVYILSSTGEKTLLWSTGGQDYVRWTKAQLKLPPHPHPHDLRVVVEGKRSPSSESNVVIDNLFVGKCR